MAKKNARKKVRKTKKTLNENSKLNAFITTFFSFIGFIIALLIWRDDEYVMFYAKQSFVLFIIALIVYLVNSLLALIPIIGWIIIFVLNVLILIGWIMTWVNALSEEKRNLYIISNFTRNFDI